MSFLLNRIVVSILLIGIIGFSALFYLSQDSNQFKAAEYKKTEIPSGMSFNEIADRLKSEDLVRSKTIFKIYSLLTGKARQFKAGKYILESDLSLFELVETLIKGPSQISATISPGMTLKEIDERLSSFKIINSGELTGFNINFLKEQYPWLNGAESPEGFLFPDTYYFFAGSEASEVVKKILANFNLKALPFFENHNNLIQILILASLLEKEIPDYNEQRIAADILMKRLKIGMPLQVDATVVYAKCSGEFLGCPALSEEDYKIDSAYNTYLYKGLPPTPISNPSPETIKAVVNYQKSDYWYYLSDAKTKKTIFSKTLDEHNQNRAKYIIGK